MGQLVFRRIGFGCLLLLVSGAAAAQNGADENLVATGQTESIDGEKSFHSVQVITSDEIEMLNFLTLHDALQYTLNNFSVYLGKDGHSMNYVGTGRKNIKFLLDGLPVFQTSIDNIDLSKISLIDVERIEILTGSSSVYNGANAALATVNIITRKTTNTVWRGRAHLTSSSGGNLNGYFKGAMNFGRHSLSVAAGQYFFSGVGGTDSLRVFQWKPRLRNHGQLNYTYKILNDLQAYFSVNYMYSKVQDRGYPIENTLRAYDTDQKVNHTVLHTGLSGKISKYHSLDFSHSYTNYALHNYKTIKILSDLSVIENDERKAFDKLRYDEYFNQIKISKSSDELRFNYEAGLEFSHQRDLERSILTAVKTNITQLAVLGNMTYRLNDELRFKGGMRYTNSNKFATRPIYELGMFYNMTDSASLIANYTSGFRTPTFNEMFYTFENPALNISGNLNLQSETFEQFNTTLRIRAKKVQVYTRLFWATSNNGIQLVQVDPENQLYQFVNNKASKLMGQNVHFVRKGDNWLLSLAVSNNGINQFPQEIGNYYFSQEFLFKSLYAIKKADLSLMFASKYVSGREEIRENALGVLDDFRQSGFWIVDVSLKQRLFDRSIFAFFGLKNLTNTMNVGGSYLPLDRLSDEEINERVPVSIDYGRRYWFSLVTEF